MSTIAINVEWLTLLAKGLTGKDITLSLDVPAPQEGVETWGQAYRLRSGGYRIELNPSLLTTNKGELILVFCHELAHVDKDNFDIPSHLEGKHYRSWLLENSAAHDLVELETDVGMLQYAIWTEGMLRRQGKTFLDMALIRYP